MHEYCLASRYRGDTGVNTSLFATSKAMTRRGVIRVLHRRLGLLLGPVVLLWFLSGLVLLWVPYPSLTEEEWFQAAEAIPPHRCCVPLSRLFQQWDRSEGIESVRLRMVGGRPVATAQFLDGTLVALDADTAEPIASALPEWTQRIARQFSTAGSVEEMNLIDHDVWTVHQRFDPYRPLWKVELSGESRPVLYISSVTGDVVQDTAIAERRWNLVGAVIHWWYWPWLRRHWAWWDRVVWWVSAVATVTVVAGGLILSRDWVKQGWSGLLSGHGKVHRGLGVIAGVATCCWMVSGWLSMDHGRWFSDGRLGEQERERFMGGRLILRDVEALPELFVPLGQGVVKEIRLIKMAGVVHIIARESSSRQQILTVTHLEDAPRDAFQDGVVKAATRFLLGDGVLTITKPGENGPESCSATDGEIASSILQVEAAGSEMKGVWVDGRIGTLVERLDSSRRLYHRLFDWLHRWEVSWLSQHCDVRRALMSLWCLFGAGLAGSGLWMGCVRLTRKVPC